MIRLFTGPLQLLAGCSQIRFPLRLLQLILQIIQACQQVLLLLFQALHLIAQFLPLLLALRLRHLLPQLLHFLSQSLLAFGQFLQPIQQLQIFLLLRALLCLSQLFLFIALFLLLQFQIHQLLLLLLGAATLRGIARILLRHQMLTLTRLIQPLQRRLLVL